MKSAAEWRALLNGAGVPAGEVLSVPDALRHPQVADRGMIARFENVLGVNRNIDIAQTGVKIDGKAPKNDTPPPMLGQNTEAILIEPGYSDAEIERLREENAI